MIDEALKILDATLSAVIEPSVRVSQLGDSVCDIAGPSLEDVLPDFEPSISVIGRPQER